MGGEIRKDLHVMKMDLEMLSNWFQLMQAFLVYRIGTKQLNLLLKLFYLPSALFGLVRIVFVADR